MSLIYFHRFLIFCAIVFGAFFAWRLFTRWQSTDSGADLGAAIGAAIVSLLLMLYLPTVRGRKPRSNRGEG
ncbi:MAG: hypothetical protein CMJ83_21620 [Planctomycetes bacterium]|nr:hypothetical protein [Planctomycetota bacterium]